MYPEWLGGQTGPRSQALQLHDVASPSPCVTSPCSHSRPHPGCEGGVTLPSADSVWETFEGERGGGSV